MHHGKISGGEPNTRVLQPPGSSQPLDWSQGVPTPRGLAPPGESRGFDNSEGERGGGRKPLSLSFLRTQPCSHKKLGVGRTGLRPLGPWLGVYVMWVICSGAPNINSRSRLSEEHSPFFCVLLSHMALTRAGCDCRFARVQPRDTVTAVGD